MNIYPLKNEQDYRRALTDIEGLMDAEFGTEDGDRLDVLVTLVENYEQKQYPIDYPNPVEAIKFAMEQHQLTVKDMVPMIGQTNRVYEILNGKRSLTLPMIKRLHKQLGIPAESLLA